MPKHRGMTLEIFVKAVDSTVMTEYFARRHPDARMPQHCTVMKQEHIDEFLSYPENAQAAGVLDEDFKRINDICKKGKNHVVRAYKHFSIPRTDTSPETLAMNLYINHPEAFDYAFAWYCYYNTPSKLSHHRMPGRISLAADRMDNFRKEIRDWFSELAKGKECIVTPYKENGLTVILIKHGSYIRTVPYWEEADKVGFHSFRPASEDILLYKKSNRVLSIKATLSKGRVQYIKSFAKCLMGDESLATRPDRDSVFTLKPLQKGSFNWNGNKDIKRIILTKAKFQLPGATEPVVSISSDNVRKTLEEEDFGFGLDAGELTYARFRFFLEIDGKTKKVTFEIIPPDSSNHSQKKYAEIIGAYLGEQGVQLI